MNDTTDLHELHILQQRLISLDQERNEILASIDTLKKQQTTTVHKKSIFTPEEKIAIFCSLFRGREDVYAKRWQNKAGKSGYAPHCANEWKRGICQKPRIKCSACSSKEYVPLDKTVIEAHLRGEIVAGIYPMTEDEKCYFLAIDFDEAEWSKDIAALRAVCHDADIPIAVERSRSGKGAHAWLFFTDAIPASLARKLGSALLTHAMSKRHEITFQSYDRLFPNQDTLPKGGHGNLIALPLQAMPRKNGNSVFINEYFLLYEDQWHFLNQLKKISEDTIQSMIRRLCAGNELGQLKVDTEENPQPWIHTTPSLLKPSDFPAHVHITKANMLYIAKEGLSQRALNHVKRLAAFRNPEFYKTQAMRMPTYNKPRIISCSEESEKYVALPRGCLPELLDMLKQSNICGHCDDATHAGKSIKVEFLGALREEQQEASAEMLKHDDGVLAATTAFGKTVVAAQLIATRKVNTLILVHRQQLLTQWVSSLSKFLRIDEVVPVTERKRGRKKKIEIIGSLGAGRDRLSSIVDVAIMQSLYSTGNVKDCMKNYGMIIVDECHHVPAFSFEQILKKSNAKYIYGLTATPTRQDGHHPIIFMYCGPIRFRVDAITQAQKRPFAHCVIPRFTGFRVMKDDNNDISIQEIYSDIVHDDMRNHLIVDDVFSCHESSRHCLVLTERTAHVDILTKMLSARISNVVALKGGLGTKETTSLINHITSTPTDGLLTIVATGKFIGEGFDEPRLDTLFLAMPISWKGTLQQYAGRLHRLYESKKEVRIYDYVDIRNRMLEKMYTKRLHGYAAIGYQSKGMDADDNSTHIIYDKYSFFPVYTQDIVCAKKTILIVSPFITHKRVLELIKILQDPLGRKVEITIVTRPIDDCTDKLKTAFEQSIETIRAIGITLRFKKKIHQKFAVIDEKVVWYGSINLLSFGSSEESMMRIVSGNIAQELIDSL